MPTLQIEGKSVQVDDAFLKLSPEEQNATVEEIAKSIGVSPKAADPVGITDVVRSMATGVPIIGGLANKANAAVSAALAPALEPLLTPGSPENIGDAPGGIGGRYSKSLEMQNARDKKFAAEHPIVDTTAKIAGGVGGMIPAVMAAPAAFGATGTMGQMIGRGAASGAALSAADAAVRGEPVSENAGIGAVTGAAGGPLGKAIGAVASKIMNRGAAPVPQNTMQAGGVDVQLPPTDPAAASKIEIARRGAAGDPAQQLIADADAQVAAQLKAAAEGVSDSLAPAGAGPRATAQGAAERVQSELGALDQTRFQTEQARGQRAAMEGDQVRGDLAPDLYTGQPMQVVDSPFAAAEMAGGGVARGRDLARRDVRGQYDAANAVPGTYDETVPRTMAEEIRARAARGDDPLHVDPQSTGAANIALRELDRTIGEGLFSNAAAPRAAADAGPGAPGGTIGGGTAAAGPTDAEIAFTQLTAKGATPERARAAVANLPGADLLPRGLLDPHTVSTAAGGSVELRPKVVEAGSVKTSADPGYDQTLQPRNRMRAASDMQIDDMAKNITPNRLGVSAEADRGAPITGPDGMVESGNGRILALRKAYADGGAQAQKYRAWLESQGVDTTGMKAPVLVRERVTAMSPEERRAFTVAANQSSTLSLAGSERALIDSRALSPEALGLIRNAGDLGAVENRDFVRQFMQTVPAAERAALMTANGDLSSEGLTRVRNAVVAKAYGNSSILTRAAESTRDEVRSISNALQSAAPEWAQLRAAVAAGRVPKELDATAHLLDAVERTARIRGRGTSLAEGMAQSDAFAQQSPESEAFMRLFYSADGKSAASGSSVGSALRDYAQQAAKVDASPGLGLGLPAVTARDILATTSAKVGAPAKLAREVSEAAQAAAVPAVDSKPITEIGVREMDNARKRLNVLRGDAIKTAMAPGGSGADLRAMDRIIAEFDNVINEAHAAGRFSGDSVLAQRLIREARAGHSQYRQTFTSRGGSDPVGRSVEKILGRYGDTAATPDEIAKLSYGPANAPGGGAATRVGQRLRQILGPTSPEWGAWKQGLLEHVRGPADAGPAKQGQRMLDYLDGMAGRGHAGTLLSADERAALRSHAENLIAAEPTPLSSLNSVDKLVRRISGSDGNLPASTAEIVNYLFGGVNTAGSKSLSVGLANRLKRDMTPEGFAQVKQGMLSHLIERPEGVADWTYKRMSENVYKFLNGSGRDLSLALYSAKEIKDLRTLADAFNAHVPVAGSTNPSGTAPMLTKIARGMAGWILPVLGFSHGGMVGAGLGVASTKAISATANKRAANEVRRLYYGPQPSGPVDPRFARAGAVIGQTSARQIGNR